MARKPKQKIKPVEARPATILSYYRALKRIITNLAKQIDRDLGPLLYDQPSGPGVNVQGVMDADNALGREVTMVFQSLYKEFATVDQMAGPLAKQALTTALKQHRRDFIKSFQQGAGIDLSNVLDPSAKVGVRYKVGDELVSRKLLIDRGVNASFEQAIGMNVALIKTIPRQYLDQVENAIYTGLRTGADGHSLKRMVMEINGQNYNRAKLIARDQLQKFNAALSQSRQQSIGVEGYVWRTSGDERVRKPEHSGKDGVRFNWNAPPPDTGHPGEDINCRCTAEPDLSNLVPWGADVEV
jgi:SPP1 gp7 family putative phage head morphogenesis protein